MFGGGPDVVGLVNQWRPKKWYRSEKKFEEDLAGFLRDNTGRQTTVRTQGRSNIDIIVNDQIGIELKRNLTPSKVDTLMGQLGRYDFPTVIIPVCGTSENAWEDLLQRSQRGSGLEFGQQQEYIPIRKEKNESNPEDRGTQNPFGFSDKFL